MNYATTYPSRDNHSPRRQKAKATEPPVGGVHPLDGSAKGCRRDTKGQKKVRADQPIANDFLKTRFLAKLGNQQMIAPAIKTANLVRDFYKSLTQLSQHYSIDLMPTAEFAYPYNIALALSDVRAKLKENVTHWDSIKVVQEKTRTYLISEERYCTGATLYFIPVIPLFLMLKDKKKKKAGALLLSACAYLYHTADIPYYRQEYTTLYWQYEMHTEWVEQDEQIEESATYLSELQQAEWVGDTMEQKLISAENLAVFQQRIKNFKAKDDFEKHCLQVAKKAYDMFMQYPNEKFFRNANAHNWVDEDFNNDNIISIEKYVSFSARNDGWLSESIFNNINEEFGNYGVTEEPTISKSFNGKPIKAGSLVFEDQLFTLLDELAHVLNNYTYPHHE